MIGWREQIKSMIYASASAEPPTTATRAVMGMLKRCSSSVFRCFRCVERSVDALTGAVGPVFIALAAILLPLGVFTFFAAIAPTLRVPLISIPICILLATNLLSQYYFACTVSPGFADDNPSSIIQDDNSVVWAQRPRTTAGVTWSQFRPPIESQKSLSTCRKCLKVRPERAHHCRVCKRCVLKYDHHCPCMYLGINQCVGLRNERHFVLFMAYLVICCVSFVCLGWGTLWLAIKFEEWDYLAPRGLFILISVLAVAIGFSVFVMLLWQLYLITSGETPVENHDNGKYEKFAARRESVFINSFNLGRKRNLELFFNVGPGAYPWWTLLLPLRVPPYTDGWSWARRGGMTAHAGITAEDELTDDDDD